MVQDALETGVPREAPAYIQSDQLAGALAEWRRLQQSDNYPFADYANFLLATRAGPARPAGARRPRRCSPTAATRRG